MSAVAYQVVPYSPLIFAERIVLVALLSPTDFIINVVDDLPAEAFADPIHREIYWRLLINDARLDDASDIEVVLDDADSADYLQQLAEPGDGKGVSPILVGEACELIRHSWFERQLAASDEIVRPRIKNVVDIATRTARGAA